MIVIVDHCALIGIGQNDVETTNQIGKRIENPFGSAKVGVAKTDTQIQIFQIQLADSREHPTLELG